MELTIWTFDWVPDGPRGFVRDLRLRWACEEAGLDYQVRSVPCEECGEDHLTQQPFDQMADFAAADATWLGETLTILERSDMLTQTSTSFRNSVLPAAALCSALALPAVAQVATGQIMSGDLGVYYEVHGDLSTGATPFLILHGGMGSINGDFGDLLPVLAEQRPVIGIEQQGHSHTGGRDAQVTLEVMRDDTLAVLDALEVKRVHVVGFSMGGMLAMELGVTAPERLETLSAISVSQNHDGMHPALVEMNRNPGSAPAPEALELIPTQEDFAQMQAAFADNPDGPAQFERTMQQLQALMITDWGWTDEEFAKLDVPTLLLLGDTDFTPVDHAAQMAEKIGAQLAVLPDTTHLSIMSRPDWLASMIANRIATVGK